MTQTAFNLLFIQQIHRCEETLRGKAKEYTGNNPDRLSAFKTATALQECTPERALARMIAKHIISLYDMYFSEQPTYDQSMWDEKTPDSLNYLFLLNELVRGGIYHE